MAEFNLVSNYFHRKAWNETWDYPISGSLIGLEKNVPALAPFYFSWETNYTPWAINTFARTHYWLALIVTMFYLLFVWLGPKFMAKRKAFDLTTEVSYWNLFVSLFSFMGAIRLVPHIFYFIYKFGFSSTLCIPPTWSYSSGAVGFWMMAFTFSKYFEYIDTVFIILRKKNLTFLHWWHHSTALLFFWDTFVAEHPPYLYFSAMNLSVHALMYYYYYLASVSKTPKWGVVVTTLQLVQMIIAIVIGFITIYYSMLYRFIPYTTSNNALKPMDFNGCYLDKGQSIRATVMYLMYFYLFSKFFWAKYFPSKPDSEKKK